MVSFAIPWISFALATAGIILSILSTVWCEWVALGQNLSFGVWNYPAWTLNREKSSEFWPCRSYPDWVSPDSEWQTSRAMTILAPIAGVAALVVIYLDNWSGKPQRRWLCAIIMALTTLFQGLTLLLLDSVVCVENPLKRVFGKCSLSWGGNASIAATAIFGAATLALAYERCQALRKPRSNHQAGEPTTEPTQETQQETNAITTQDEDI